MHPINMNVPASTTAAGFAYIKEMGFVIKWRNGQFYLCW